MMHCFAVLLLFYHIKIACVFTPDASDYDAYGIKMTVNDALFVQANGVDQAFLVEFAPYDFKFDSLQCTIDYDDPTHYVYSVAIGQLQNNTQSPYFYFTGEVVSKSPSGTDASGNNGTFVGIWINRDSKPVQQYVSMKQPFNCDFFKLDRLMFISSYGHQEYFVIAVEPYGQYAIGLATDFAFIYQPFSTNPINVTSTKQLWSNNATFYPCAADASETFTIVAGFVENSGRSRIRATPAVYLLSNNNLTVLSTWSYSAVTDSWQAFLTYQSINIWSNAYTMSVDINSFDSTRVLVGMPFINTVFLFVVRNNGTNLTLASSFDNGRSVGYGKSVSWLTLSQAAVLATTYSMNYGTWYSSQVYLYTSLKNTIIPAVPSAVFPNNQQPIPSTISPKLIRMVSTPSSLGILDKIGGVLLIIAAEPGDYASTDTSNSAMSASMPVVSRSMDCSGGTYKADSGVHVCTLCPSGSRSAGGDNSTSCVRCSDDCFCPLGAVHEINASWLTSVSQAYAYPRSPEMDVFEDILLSNMFSLGDTWHCIIISPVFWLMMLAAVILVALFSVILLKQCVHPYKHRRLTTTMKEIFEKTDLVREGELWIGGLASLGIILMSLMAYGFGALFLYQYPAEMAQASNFACDTTMRNAKFQSSLQALAVPISEEERPMFELLDGQNFTFAIDFINTAAACTSLSISKITESSTVSLPFISCSSADGVLSASVSLPEHDSKIIATISSVQIIGGLRVGLLGSSAQIDSHKLKELNFRQVFHSESERTLAQTATISLALTKVVNETLPLFGKKPEFEGIWYPTFKYSLDAMFMSAEFYSLYANISSTTVGITISETSYYIKNEQAPITKQTEVVFRTLLFSFLCLEICTMIFIVFKLCLIPIYYKTAARCFGHSPNSIDTQSEMKPFY